MISAIMPEPAVSGTTNLTDYRYRPAMGERTMLPDSAPVAPKTSSAGADGQFPQDEPPPRLPEPDRDQSSMFAAAVIAGALSPTPQTMQQLILRIGSSMIPEESQARLKDLIA